MEPSPEKKRRGKAVKPKKGEAATFEAGAAAAPKVFDAQKIAEELNLWWENEGGDSFWIGDDQGWAKWPSGGLLDLLTSKFVRKKAREGEYLSEAARLMIYLRRNRRVEGVMLGISGYPSGVHDLQDGRRVLVRTSPRKIEPKEGDWQTVSDLIHSKLKLPDGKDQTVYFHAWMRTAIEGLYYGGPGNFRPGQCLIFAGPRDSGKSRIQHQIITGLLGGRSADPGPYLFGRTDFNGEMFAAEHLMMEDPASTTKTVDRVYFGEMLKQLVVNDTQRFHAKREDAIVVSPFFRSTISINDDPDKMRVLPLLTPDLKDKVMLFLVSSAALPMPTGTLAERAEFRRKITEELPAYAWWLLNEFEIPDKLVSSRFGVKEWHHPGLAMELFDDTPAAELLTLIDAAVFNKTIADDGDKLWELDRPNLSKKPGEMWEESALNLEKILLGEWPDLTCSVAREAKKLFMHNKVDRLLARLAEDQPDRVAPHRLNNARRWIVSKPV